MYRDRNSSLAKRSLTKENEVDLVNRFLAPLCARDEAARNIALAAARSTVEEWLGGVDAPNYWPEDTVEMEEAGNLTGKSKSQDGRYDIERSPTRSSPKNVYHNYNKTPHLHQQQPPYLTQPSSVQLYQQVHHTRQQSFGTEGFFPRSVTENTTFLEEGSSGSMEKNPSGSFDSIDGRLTSNEQSIVTSKEKRVYTEGYIERNKSSGHSTSSDEGKAFKIEHPRCLKFADGTEARFSSSSESERKFLSSSSCERLNESTNEDRTPKTKHFIKVKGAKQKQVEDNDLDPYTRSYGKSPKFDGRMREMAHRDSTAQARPSLSNFDLRNANSRSNINDLLPSQRLYDSTDEVFFVENDVAADFLTGGQLREGVVFNTLDGFDNDNTIDNTKDEERHLKNLINLEYCIPPNNYDDDNADNNLYNPRQESHPDYLRKNEERKFSAGQIKRPLSQDEDVSTKTGRVLESPEVTPGDVGRMLNLGNALDDLRQPQPNKYFNLVMLHLPVILRLSVNCPFRNVRMKCADILEMVKGRGLPVPFPASSGPSSFVPASELPDLNSLDEKTHMLLMDAFLQNNRLDHVSRVMSSHPTYLEHFLRTQHFILRGDGPLPYDYRHLIAIMAAGRHQCSYLINLQKGEFLLQGGDSLWLQGLRSIPGKLQDLYEINKILAHRPWLLNKTHIEKLTKGADNWSLAEVVHAIVLLAHFHSLSSFVFSCGINEELDNVSGHRYKENDQDSGNNDPPAKDQLSNSPKKIPNGDGKTEPIPSPPLSPSIVGEQEVGVKILMERMKRLSEKSESYQITQEELSKRFETVETQSAELAAAPQRNSKVLDSDIGLFIDDPTFIYQDFAKRGQLNDIPTFRVQDYSWDDHGYSLVNRLYNDVGNLLDDKFKTAYNLTYYTMGTHNKVDTSRFRRAIWNYIQCMFGIRHDDYDYNEVNQLLERSLKTFIKSAVCYPERVTKRDYDRVMREFKHSEKVHVNLMILEARMQAELLYALRAVMRYMT
ncbi:uncharacterized protein Sesn [Prorops nasuta]|uniref:uncharacterized protein Sesn n=1 Tax=Prorops nasuta TaxID=863751 RepID=UPI0034CE5663